MAAENILDTDIVSCLDNDDRVLSFVLTDLPEIMAKAGMFELARAAGFRLAYDFNGDGPRVLTMRLKRGEFDAARTQFHGLSGTWTDHTGTPRGAFQTVRDLRNALAAMVDAQRRE